MTARPRPQPGRSWSRVATAAWPNWPSHTTGLGNVPDKITKNHRKTLGLMRDIAGAQTFGVISDDPATGITEIARPKGVVGAIVPSTNPAATPANNIINALKCGNAIVVAPSPKGVACAETPPRLSSTPNSPRFDEDPDPGSDDPPPPAPKQKDPGADGNCAT